MKLLDTHQHLWDLDRFPYSWCAGIDALNRSFRLPDYRKAIDGTGIDRAIFMEADVDEPYLLEEARQIQALSESDPLIAGIVASCRPERDGFREHLEELVKLPKLRGLRRVLHNQPDELSQSPRFREHLNLLPAYGLTFDLCVLAHQLPIGIDLVERCPEVRIVLDHCGIPDVRHRAFKPWQEHIRRMAGLPNVNCKISGLVAYADPERWTPEDLRPWVETVLEHFGWDRVVWGGDWPVCTLSASLRQWVDTTLLLTGNASPADREKLFHRNAERIYRV